MKTNLRPMGLLRLLWLAIWLCVIPQFSFSQGKIVLVGGGTEKEGGWSDKPYQWGVEKAAIRKVAIISNNEETDFLPDYFKSLGATEAKNFQIDSRALANSNTLYNELKEYGVFFFKGGDQARYYGNFKGTKLESAIQELFLQGGVLMGTSAGAMILSGVNSLETVYPNEMLENYDNQYVNLGSDFTRILPNFIVDTHFLERGRLGRLPGFLANRLLENQEFISGIGVDDQTALCIDENRIATVFGTGAVTIIPSTSFDSDGPRAHSPEFELMALLEDDQINLNTFEVSGFSNEVIPSEMEENFPNELWLTGGETPSENEQFISELVSLHSDKSVAIVTGSVTSQAESYQTQLVNRGFSNVSIIQAIAENSPNAAFNEGLAAAELVILTAMDNNSLMNFVTSTEDGASLLSKISSEGTVLAIIGENSTLAGAHFCSNLLSDSFAAYYNELEFAPALGLLKTFAITSNMYGPADYRDYFENRTAAVHYLMVTEKLRRGMWLSPGNYVRYLPNSGNPQLIAAGDLSVTLQTNNGTKAEIMSFVPVRMGIGFESMNFQLLKNGEPLLLNVVYAPIEAPIPQFTIGTSAPFETEQPIAFTNQSVNAEAYEWVFPNNVVSLEENPTYTFTEAGDYLISLVAHKGPVGRTYSQFIHIEEAEVTAIEDEIFKAVQLYPNPASEVLKVNWKGESFSYELLSLDGKRLKSESIFSEAEIPLQQLPKGLYGLRLWSGGFQKTFKFMVQ